MLILPRIEKLAGCLERLVMRNVTHAPLAALDESLIRTRLLVIVTFTNARGAGAVVAGRAGADDAKASAEAARAPATIARFRLLCTTSMSQR